MLPKEIRATASLGGPARPTVRRIGSVDWGKRIIGPAFRSWAQRTGAIAEAEISRAWGRKRRWPRSSTAGSSRRETRRNRYGRASADSFTEKVETADDAARTLVLNSAPYARALDRGAYYQRGGWKRRAANVTKTTYRRSIKPALTRDVEGQMLREIKQKQARSRGRV